MLSVGGKDSRDCWANGVEEYAMYNNIVSHVTEEHETEFVGCLAFAGWCFTNWIEFVDPLLSIS